MYEFKDCKDAYGQAKRYWKNKEVAPFPHYVTFELVNACNFRCLMCAVTYLRRNREEIDFNIFKKAIDEISQYGSLVRFIGYAEPFLYSRIEDAIKYVKAKRLLLHITTNGSLLNRKVIKKIIDFKLDSIVFSFQGLTKEEYCIMRNTSIVTYRKIINNIKLLYNLRKEKKPYIKITTTVTNRDNPNDKNRFIEAHSSYADEVQITGFTNFIRIGCLSKKDIWEEFKIKKPKKVNNVSCFIPNIEIIIKQDGSVYPCCGVFTGDLKIGNIKEDASNLLDAWNSHKAAYIRNVLSSGAMERFKDCAVCSIRYKYEDMDSTVMNIMK